MTTFRILEETRLDGKTRYYVQQWRLFYWSDTFYYANGGACYTGGSATTLHDAQQTLKLYQEQDREKMLSRPWNKTRRVMENV